MDKRIILGVDPGIAHVGLAIIVCSNGTAIIPRGGLVTVRTKAKLGAQERLARILEAVTDIHRRFQPSIVAMEEYRMWGGRTKVTGIGGASMSIGVVTAYVQERGIPLHMVSTNDWRLTIAGSRTANDREVAYAHSLRHPELKALGVVSGHALDALGVAGWCEAMYRAGRLP